MLMRGFFLGVVDEETALSFFEKVRNQYARGGEKLPPEPVLAEETTERDVLFASMVLDYGKRMSQMTVEWADDCIRKIRENPDGGFS